MGVREICNAQHTGRARTPGAILRLNHRPSDVLPVRRPLSTITFPRRMVIAGSRGHSGVKCRAHNNAEAHAAELAHHFSEAEAALGTKKLVRYSLIAGERAFNARGYEEALAQYQRGLAAKEGQTDLTGRSVSPEQEMDVEKAELLYGLGCAQATMLSPSQRQDALSKMRRAFDFYFQSGDVERAVAIANTPLFIGFEGSRASEVGVMALSLVPPDSYEAGRLLCHFGITIYHETVDYEGAKEAFARAGVIARREADIALEAQILSNSAHVDADEYHREEA